MSPTLEQTIAVHESAHAVVSIVLGIPVRMATMNIQAVTGSVTSAVRWDEEELDAAIVSTLAGAAAERELTGAVAFAARDYADTRKLLSACLATDDEEAITKCLVRCEQLADVHVRGNWKWIERVAAALIRHRTLRGDQVAAFMEG